MFWYDTHILHWYLCHGTFSWCGFAARTTNGPHGSLYPSVTTFSSRVSTKFRISSYSLGPYIGGLQQIGEWIPVSIWNENTHIGRQNPSSPKTSQYSVTKSLNLSCKSLGKTCNFKFLSNSFVLVHT